MSNVVNSRRVKTLTNEAFLARTPREIQFSQDSAAVLEKARELVSAKQGREVPMARIEERPSSVAGHRASTLCGEVSPVVSHAASVRTSTSVPQAVSVQESSTGASSGRLHCQTIWARPKSAPLLSTREISVLAEASRGRSNTEIAAALGLSAATVKTHIARMSERLEVKNRTALVVAGLRAGLIQAEPYGPGLEEADLSEVETAMLRALGEGQTNVELARTLVIALDTAKGYVAKLSTRLGAKDRTHVVVWGHARGVLR